MHLRFPARGLGPFPHRLVDGVAVALVQRGARLGGVVAGLSESCALRAVEVLETIVTRVGQALPLAAALLEERGVDRGCGLLCVAGHVESAVLSPLPHRCASRLHSDCTLRCGSPRVSNSIRKHSYGSCCAATLALRSAVVSVLLNR